MKLLSIVLLLFPTLIFGHALEQGNIPFRANISNIPLHIENKVKKYTWRPGCPVPLSDLRHIEMNYWGFDNKPHIGSIIVNKALATEVTQIFKSLYEHQFPIERMELVDEFQGDDNASMSANNTSAFNCRSLTGLPSAFSQHSYGRAIDINPKINPFINGKQVLPANGVKFINRHEPYPGKITKNSLIYKLFTQHGWDWGGNWYDVQDYHHVEKRVNGKKRNPYGAKFKTKARATRADKISVIQPISGNLQPTRSAS